MWDFVYKGVERLYLNVLLFSLVLVVWEVSVKGREECIRVRREWCGGFECDG